MSLQRNLSACFLASALLTSCASPHKEPEVNANGKKIEYVYYTPTGSNLPIRVRKDEMNTSESDTDAAQKALTDFQRESGADKNSSAGGR